MLPKDIHPDNPMDHPSEGAAADAGNIAVARAVIGRYMGGPVPGRTVSFMQRTAHPELAGEKCLSLAGDLTRRWKWGAGSTVLSDGPLPLLRKVFPAGTESSIGEQVFPEAKPLLPPAACTVIPPSRGGDNTSALPVLDTAGKNNQPQFDMAPGITVGRQPEPGGEPASTAAAAPFSPAKSATGRQGKSIAKKNREQAEFTAGSAPTQEQPAVEANMAAMSMQVMGRHFSHSLARKYWPSSDNFNFLREKSELSRTLAATHRNPSPETHANRRGTLVSRKAVNTALSENSQVLPESRVSRETAERIGAAGNSSGRGHAAFTGFRPLVMRRGPDTEESRAFSVTGFQGSVGDIGTPQEEGRQGTTSFSQAGGQTSALPLPKGVPAKSANTVAELAGTRISRATSGPATASGLPTGKATHGYPPYAKHNDGKDAVRTLPSAGNNLPGNRSATAYGPGVGAGSDSVFTMSDHGTIYPLNAFRPLTFRGNAGIIRNILRRPAEAPFLPGDAKLQMSQNRHIAVFPAPSGGLPVTRNSGADSTGRESGPHGRSEFTFFARHAKGVTADAGTGLSPEKHFRPGETMPLLNRKSSSGSESRGTGNGRAMAGGVEPPGLSGFLQRSPAPDGGTATAPGPAASATPATNAHQVAAAGDNGSASLDLERIADEVYHIIERRLIVEKERKGL